MPTVDQIISEVSDIIKDDSYGPSEILRRLSECLYFVARRLNFSDLEGEDTITTATDAYVKALPSDFHHNLFDCWSGTHNRQLKVHDSKRAINQYLDRLDSGGSVIAVCQDGRNLYYQRQPSVAETLRLFYYKKPTSLALAGNLPTYIDDDFHDSLFVNFACWKLYARIEDGVDGEKVNTLYYKKEFYEALGDAITFYKPEPETQRDFSDHMVGGLY